MYFPKFRHRGLGLERYVGHTVVGWRIAFRRWRVFCDQPRRQRREFDTPSRFGALRALIRDSRAWHGKLFFLEIEDIQPICVPHYELVEEEK